MTIYHDRLTSGLDKGLFLVTWAAGTLGLLTLKALGRSGVPIVLWTTFVLLAYASVIWRSPKFRVREDRAGDSCYYLGFLFTLSSLAYALWEFSRTGNDPRGVIGNFSVALSSTILGLVLRVTFQQFREDPFEVEQEVRLELSEAARRLKDEVMQSVEGFSSLRTAIGQELRNEFTKAIAQVAAESTKTIRTVTTEHSDAVAKALASIVETAQAMKIQVSGIRTSSKRTADAFERLAEKLSDADVTKPFEQVSGAAAATAESMKQVAASSEDLRRGTDAMSEASKGITVKLTEWRKQLADGTENWKAATQTEAEMIKAQLLAVEQAVRALNDLQRSLEQAVGDSQKAVVKTHTSLASLADAIAERV